MDANGPLAYRKSSFSGNGDCLEWAYREGTVYVRHSRDPHGSVLSTPRKHWLSFTAAVLADSPAPGDLTYSAGPGGFHVRTPGSGRLTFSRSEWVAFRHAVRAGETTPPGADAPGSAPG